MENGNIFKKDIYNVLKTFRFIFNTSRLIRFDRHDIFSYNDIYRVYFIDPNNRWFPLNIIGFLSITKDRIEYTSMNIRNVYKSDNTEKFYTQKSRFYLNFEDLYNEDKKK